MTATPRSLIEDLTRGFWWLLIGCGIFAVGVLYVEWRFDSRLRYRPPHASDTLAHHVISDEQILESDQRQSIYVPAYSHVYHQDGRPLLLTVTLSIRNTNRDHEIIVMSVRYYDSHGREVRSHLEKPLRLQPLSTVEFLVVRDDEEGGSGASFIVEWAARDAVAAPLVESVMVDTESGRGISFARRGILHEVVDEPVHVERAAGEGAGDLVIEDGRAW